MAGTMGWIRRNTGPTGRIVRAAAGSALVAGSFLLGPKWLRSMAAATGGALAMEAATGFCFMNVAAKKLSQNAAQDSL